MAESRTAPRSKNRLPCMLRTEESRHSALVLDVSATGLFVQTSASLNPGTELVVELNPPGRDALLLKGQVARQKVVPLLLKAVEHGGLGSRVSQIVSCCRPVPMSFVAIKDTYAQSGKPHELLKRYGLAAEDIERAVQSVVQRKLSDQAHR